MKVPNYRDIEWSQASCAGQDTALYYDLQPGEALGKYPLMRRVCHGCPILADCYSWSLTHERYGFWAGMSADERKNMRSKYNIPLSEPNHGLDHV